MFHLLQNGIGKKLFSIPDFPWAFDIGPDPITDKEGVAPLETIDVQVL